jgi:hypothetical protein
MYAVHAAARGQLCCARPGPKHFLTRFFCARTKNMPPWTQSPMPRCEHELSLVDRTTGLYNSMPPMGAGGHDRVLVFPRTGHMSLRFALLDAGFIRVISGPCGPIPARPLCKMTQWGSHRMGGNRANRLTPLILLLLCIREHRWLTLHSRVVALPVHPHLLPEIVLARVHLASAGQEVALARPDPSPSVHHCMAIQLSLLFPLPG